MTIPLHKYCEVSVASPVKQPVPLPTWISEDKYHQALQLLQNSVYFKGRQIDPAQLNLSRGQLDTIFGPQVQELMAMGIIVRKKSDNNPFGGGTASFTLANPGQH